MPSLETRARVYALLHVGAILIAIFGMLSYRCFQPVALDWIEVAAVCAFLALLMLPNLILWAAARERRWLSLPQCVLRLIVFLLPVAVVGLTIYERPSQDPELAKHAAFTFLREHGYKSDIDFEQMVREGIVKCRVKPGNEGCMQVEIEIPSSPGDKPILICDPEDPNEPQKPVWGVLWFEVLDGKVVSFL
jgi:hypothetical protein